MSQIQMMLPSRILVQVKAQKEHWQRKQRQKINLQNASLQIKVIVKDEQKR